MFSRKEHLIVICFCTIFFTTNSVQAFDLESLKFCTESTYKYVASQNNTHSSSTSNEGGLGVSYEGVGFNGSSKNAISSQGTEQANSEREYAARNCDSVLREAARITIADINRDRDIAIAKLKMQQNAYDQDTLKAIKEIEANVQINRNQTDFNANVINTMGDVMKSNAVGSATYLSIDRQSQSQELQDSLRNQQMYEQQRMKETENEMKSKFKY